MIHGLMLGDFISDVFERIGTIKYLLWTIFMMIMLYISFFWNYSEYEYEYGCLQYITIGSMVCRDGYGYSIGHIIRICGKERPMN